MQPEESFLALDGDAFNTDVQKVAIIRGEGSDGTVKRPGEIQVATSPNIDIWSTFATIRKPSKISSSISSGGLLVRNSIRACTSSVSNLAEHLRRFIVRIEIEELTAVLETEGTVVITRSARPLTGLGNASIRMKEQAWSQYRRVVHAG